MSRFGVHGVGRSLALLLGGSAVALSAAMVTAGSANAADLTCVVPPQPDVAAMDGATACGAQVDEYSRAFARALDGVAFSRADLGGTAVSLAHSGGVAATETAGGTVGALSLGADSVSIISADPGAVALAMSMTQGRTFVGTAAEGVRCEAGAGVAVNLTTGQVCLSDGVTHWNTGLSLP